MLLFPCMNFWFFSPVFWLSIVTRFDRAIPVNMVTFATFEAIIHGLSWLLSRQYALNTIPLTKARPELCDLSISFGIIANIYVYAALMPWPKAYPKDDRRGPGPNTPCCSTTTFGYHHDTPNEPFVHKTKHPVCPLHTQLNWCIARSIYFYEPERRHVGRIRISVAFTWVETLPYLHAIVTLQVWVRPSHLHTSFWMLLDWRSYLFWQPLVKSKLARPS